MYVCVCVCVYIYIYTYICVRACSSINGKISSISTSLSNVSIRKSIIFARKIILIKDSPLQDQDTHLPSATQDAIQGQQREQGCLDFPLQFWVKTYLGREKRIERMHACNFVLGFLHVGKRE